MITGLADTPQNTILRAEAITALGKIANAFCEDNKEAYSQLILPVIETVYWHLQNSKDFEIKEACFSLFYNLAAALKNDFAVFFDKIINLALQSAASEEGLEY